jgi:lysophospholipase L1-like esterase
MNKQLIGPLAVFLACAAPVTAEDFALRDGDTVVFLGDSITAARQYDRVIENYTLLRYPQRKVRFINAGHGGDTMKGGLARLERDVFDRGATVLFAAFGVNDIGWGMKADAEHKQAYLDSVRGIIERCQERKVRVFICSAAITAEDPDKAEQNFLQKMCDEGLALARSLGAGTVDVQRGMREIQRRVITYNANVKQDKDRVSLHVADGIHLSDLGQQAMAFSILKNIGAPADVSSAAVDAREGKLVSASGCTVTNVRNTDSALEFDRLDEGWPVNFGTFGALNFRFVPFHNDLGRYQLTVANLAPGKYDVLAADRALGTFDAQALAGGSQPLLRHRQWLGTRWPVGCGCRRAQDGHRRPLRGGLCALLRRHLFERASGVERTSSQRRQLERADRGLSAPTRAAREHSLYRAARSEEGLNSNPPALFNHLQS